MESDRLMEHSDDENVERPMVPKPFLSTTMEDTMREISNFSTVSRPLLKMQFIKKRREYGQGYKFNEQDASERFTEIKSQNDPLNHVKTKVVEIGIQGCNRLMASGTQTTWNRKMNKGLQVEDTEEILDIPDDDQELKQCLDNVNQLMEEALQSNETIDIYQDDFDVLPKNESQDGQQTTDLSNMIKEMKSFSYLNCKGKKISCIQFQPSNQGSKCKSIVAESFQENLLFEDRVIYSVKSHKSLIVFWDFDDIHSIEPVLILSSPLEILTFEFNAKDPNLVIGGAMNGQIMLWELSGTSLSVFSSKKNQKGKQEKNEIQEVPPKILSALQDPASVQSANTTEILRKSVASHKNPVLSIKWLPSAIEIDRKIFYNLLQNTTNECHQFATISMDGQVLIWDTRFQEKDQKKPTQDIAQVQWRAAYGIQLYRPEGGGQMGGAQIAFRKNQKNSIFTGTSDEGELFVVDWCVRPTEENTKADMVQMIWQNERSYRPTVGLDVSVFYDDIILTLHDFNFCVWKHDIHIPVFESMLTKNAHISCGGFSPFRPGVIVMGKTDGSLDVWDLLDQSHKWTVQYNVVACALTSLKFHETIQNTMAVGDLDGTLHLLEFPSTLSRIQGDEKKSMQEFWEREVKRVEYYTERFRIRDEQAKADKQKREQQEQLENAKEQNKPQNDDKKEDETDQIELEYQKFCETYLAEKDGKPVEEKKLETIKKK